MKTYKPYEITNYNYTTKDGHDWVLSTFQGKLVANYEKEPF